MEKLAEQCLEGSDSLHNALKSLPEFYDNWINSETQKIPRLKDYQGKIGTKLIEEMKIAKDRILEGIQLLRENETARQAFRFMNLAISSAARKRSSIIDNSSDANRPPPQWRPFQLAFILLNISALVNNLHPDRKIADLLFFPTGGGKTEAYLGLSAFTIVLRRLNGPGLLGAGVAVIMRYTLRLLTLDQLSRAAGVICALELLRNDKQNLDKNGNKILGDWPIEIGLWVGSDASPNYLKGKGNSDQNSAIYRIRQYRSRNYNDAPAPIKSCPWCGEEFTKESFACVPNDRDPLNLEIRCMNLNCEFNGDQPLPILTVDEPIYRRLPAFLIATIDKFAGLPRLGESGAFFGHVDRFTKGCRLFWC